MDLFNAKQKWHLGDCDWVGWRHASVTEETADLVRQVRRKKTRTVIII